MSEDIRRQLYNKMKEAQVFDGDYSSFTSDIDKPEFRQQLYDQLHNAEVYTGKFEDFDRDLTGDKKRYSVTLADGGKKYFGNKEEGDVWAKQHKNKQNGVANDAGVTPMTEEEQQQMTDAANSVGLVASPIGVDAPTSFAQGFADFNERTKNPIVDTSKFGMGESGALPVPKEADDAAQMLTGTPLNKEESAWDDYGNFVGTKDSRIRRKAEYEQERKNQRERQKYSLAKELAELTAAINDTKELLQTETVANVAAARNGDMPNTSSQSDLAKKLRELNKRYAEIAPEYTSITSDDRNRVMQNIDDIEEQIGKSSKAQDKYISRRQGAYDMYVRGNISKEQWEKEKKNIANEQKNDKGFITDLDQYRSEINYNLGEARKLIKQADRSGNAWYVTNLWYGFTDKVLDTRNWDFGAQDLITYYRQRGLLSKFEDKQSGGGGGSSLGVVEVKLKKGEKLSKGEELWLKSIIVKAAAEDLTQHSLGKGYVDGQITAEALPFMLEFYVAGAAGDAVKGAAKGMIRTSVKGSLWRKTMALVRNAERAVGGVEKSLAKSATGRLVNRTARIVGEQISAGAKAAAMSVTTGSGKLAGSTLEKMNGEASYDYDKDGNIIFTGVDPNTRLSASEAFNKSLYESWKENFTEMGGGLVSLAGRTAGKTLGRSLVGTFVKNNVKCRDLYKWLYRAGSSQSVMRMQNFFERTQWHGTFGEYWEEVEGNVMDATVAKMTNGRWGDGKNFKFDANAEGSVFNLEDNIDTFRSLAIMGIVTSGISTGAYLWDRHNSRRSNGANDLNTPTSPLMPKNFISQYFGGTEPNTVITRSADEVRNAFAEDTRATQVLQQIDDLYKDGNYPSNADLLRVCDGLSENELRATLNYIGAKEGALALGLAQHGMGRDADAAVRQAIDEETEEQAQEEKPAEDKRTAAQQLADAQAKVQSFGQALLNQCDQFLESGADFFASDFAQNLSEEEKEACMEYFAAVAAVKSIEQNDTNQADAAVEAEEEALSDVPQDGQGNVTYATIDGKTYYVMEQDGENITLMDGQGNVVQTKEKILDKDGEGNAAYHEMNMDEHLQQVWDEAHEAQQQKSLHEMQHHQNTPSMSDVQKSLQTGEPIIGIVNGTLQSVGVTNIITMRDGRTAIGIAPYKTDRDGNKILDENNISTILYDDFVSENDAYWDNIDQQASTLSEGEEELSAEDVPPFEDEEENVEEVDDTVGSENEPIEEDAESNITTDEEGEPDFTDATEEDIVSWFSNQGDDIASPFIDAYIGEAKAQVEKLNRKKPDPKKYGTKIAKYKNDLAAWQQQIDEAQSSLDRWKNVKAKYQTKRADDAISERSRKSNAERLEKLDIESMSWRDYVLAQIASGQSKFKATGNGRTRGIAEHTTGRKSIGKDIPLFMLDNTNGMYPEVLAQHIWENMPQFMYEQITDQDVFEEILDIINTYRNYTEMVDALEQRYQEYSEEWDEQEAIEDMENQEAAAQLDMEELSQIDFNKIEEQYADEYAERQSAQMDAEPRQVEGTETDEVGTDNAEGNDSTDNVLGEKVSDNDMGGDRTDEEPDTGNSEDSTVLSDDAGERTDARQNEESSSDNVETDNYTIAKQHHKKADKDIWVVRPKEKVDSDTFKANKKVATKHGGYYSSFSGVHGYVFDSAEDAQAFADSIWGESKPQQKGETEAPQAEHTETPAESNAEELERSSAAYTVEDTRSDINAITLNPLSETDTTQLIVGDKWESTPEPKKFTRNRKQRDNARVNIGNKSYGCTGGILDTIETLLDGFGSAIKLWNAYENGKIILDPDTAAIIKQFLKEEYNTPLQNNTHDYKVGDKVMYKGEEATIKEFYYDGRPVLEADLAPFMVTVANWEDISRIEDKEETPTERMLTADEIDASSVDDYTKLLAKEYLKGDTKLTTTAAYNRVLSSLKAETPEQRTETKKKVEVKRKASTKRRKKTNQPVQGDLFAEQAESTKPANETTSKPTNEALAKEERDKKKKELAEKIKARLAKAKNSGKLYSSVIPGISPEKLEAIADVLPLLGEYGKLCIEDGYYTFKEWAKVMFKELKPYVDGLLDNVTLNSIIGETWNNPVVADGKVLLVSQWAEQFAKDAAKQNNADASNEGNNISLQQPQGNSTNLNTNNNGKETDLRTGTAQSRTGGQQSDKNGTLGGSTENATQQPVTGGMDRRDGAHSANDESGNSGVAGTDASTESNVSVKKNQNNNRAERGMDYAPKSPKARYDANIKAIKILLKIEDEKRNATPQEMETLRKYSGWGGLGGFINNEAQTLIDLIGVENFEAAANSANSAYFTPAKVIDALWDIAEKLGFKGGKILEGSAGIGNILGLMPQGISNRSDIRAVEIDNLSSRILSVLYPDAKVDAKGFEETQIENNSIDLAITNVPFVPGQSVHDETGDKDLSRRFKDIHNFCIAKNIRKLKQGGIGIFITTRGTLDKSKALRQWITSEGDADVVGAFRLNSDTFGGTNATSDIIIVRKRVNGQKSADAIDVSTVSVERVAEYHTTDAKGNPTVQQLPVSYNSYFVQHPWFMGGVMRYNFEDDDTFRETSMSLKPSKDIDQMQRLAEWVETFDKQKKVETVEEQTGDTSNYEDVSEDVKHGTLLVNSKGEICIAQKGKAVPLQGKNMSNKVKGQPKTKCIKDYNAIKTALADVLKYQTEHKDDKGLAPLLKKLNSAYDNFVRIYGHFYRNTALSFLKSDVDYSEILGLESVKEVPQKDGSVITEYKKAEVFNNRVIGAEEEPTPSSVEDAISVSIHKYGRIAIDYIAHLLGKAQEEIHNFILDNELGYIDPQSGDMVVSYQYLSGDVLDKLEYARENNTDGRYDKNIAALEKILPMQVPSHLINISLGATWIPVSLYTEYIKEKTARNIIPKLVGGKWVIDTRNNANGLENHEFGVRSEKFGKFITGVELISAAMNNGYISVTQKNEDITEIDKEATQACQRRIGEIKDEFRDWIRDYLQSHADVAKEIEDVYNHKFNNYVPLTIPDKFVPERFIGSVTTMNGKPFKLYAHQAKAVIKALTHNILFAHEVGTGKTYTLITTAMEMKRIGTAKKPMIVVQNATLGQFAQSAKQLYPNAKVLAYDESDKGSEGRRNFYANIRYNDWDMIIIPQSVLEKIPDSDARQAQYIQEKIDEKLATLEAAKELKDNRLSSSIQKEIDSLQDELSELNKKTVIETKVKDVKRQEQTKSNTRARVKERLDRAVDEVVDFDQMGVDALLVDEAHNYKHLGFATSLARGIRGVSSEASKRSQSVFLKCQAVMDKSNGKNVVFATGTPISNTAAEIWTFLKYLLPADKMKQYDMQYFDDFIHNFGRISQMSEFTTSGKFKEVSRFAGYENIPELMRRWQEVTDTKLSENIEELQSKLPDTVEGSKKPTYIYLPQTPTIRRIMSAIRRDLEWYESLSKKEKDEHKGFVLQQFTKASMAAIDPRLVASNAPDEAGTKTNRAVDETLKALEESKDYNGTIAIFCDSYQNKNTGFNLYEDIKQKLVARGVQEDEIFIVKSDMSQEKKLRAFEDVNKGKIRVILGSTSTLGTGVNIQERLYTEINLDVPSRPMDMTQRVGRILRQGNMHKDWNIPVKILNFGIEDTLDVSGYQRLKTKSSFIDVVMHNEDATANNLDNRTYDEEEEDVGYGDAVANLSGSEYAILKNSAERTLRRLQSKKQQHEADQRYIKQRMAALTWQIATDKQNKERFDKALNAVSSTTDKTIKIGKYSFATIDSMEDFIKNENKKKNEVLADLKSKTEKSGYRQQSQSVMTVNVGGFDFEITTNMEADSYINRETNKLDTASHARMYFSCEQLGIKGREVERSLLKNALVDIVDNIISGKYFEEKSKSFERAIEHEQTEYDALVKRQGRKFEQEEELAKAQTKVLEYEEKMKVELEAKEKKYAELDKQLLKDSNASDIQFADIDEGESGSEAVKQSRSVSTETTEQETALRDALADIMQSAGIDVDMENGQQVLDEVNDISTPRFAKSTDLDKMYPNWNDTQTTSKGGHSTQIVGTVSTYKKIGNMLEQNGMKNVSILDASSGKGAGTDALREMGFNVDDVEPYAPSDRKSAPTYDSYNKIGKKYDVVISNAVLNVIPDDWRADVLRNMAGLLNDNGIMIINTRGLEDVKSVKNKVEIDDASEILISNGKGGFRSYQKFFNHETLTKFITDTLGEGYEVEKATKENAGFSNSNAVVVRKKAEKKDAQITGKERFFRTSDGEVYGFVKGGKIYLDPRIATAETAIHEYSHLWTDALRTANPEAWEHLKQQLLGNKEVMDVVKKLYPELEGDDLMDEVFQHFAGKRGAERLREEQRKQEEAAKDKSTLDNIKAAFKAIRKTLKEFWQQARDLFAGNNENLADLSAEDFADMMLNDLLNGFNPKSNKEGIRLSQTQDNPFVTNRKAKELANIFRTWSLEEMGETVENYVFNHPTIKEALGNREASDIYDYLTTLNEKEYKRLTSGRFYYPVPSYDDFLSMDKEEAIDEVDEFKELVIDNFINDRMTDVDWVKENMPELVNSVRFDEDATPTGEAHKALGVDEEAGIDTGSAYIDEDALKNANNDVRFSIASANQRGYTEDENGKLLSNRAYYAKEDGRYPKMEFRKAYQLTGKSFDVLNTLGIIGVSEWHHTGLHFNKTDFFAWADDSSDVKRASLFDVDNAYYADGVEPNSLANKYLTNKTEIDKLAKEYDNASWEYKDINYVPKYETFAHNYAVDNTRLTEQEQSVKEMLHANISENRSGLSSSERYEMHKKIDERYFRILQERIQKYVEEHAEELRQKYNEEYGEKIKENNELDDINSKTNGKEQKLIQICRLLGLDEEQIHSNINFFSHRNREKEKEEQEAIERRRKRAEIDAEKQRLQNEFDKWIVKGIKDGKIIEVTRVRDNELPELFDETKAEMNGRYGWFKARPYSYNLPIYKSGYAFASKATYNAYTKRKAEIYNLELESYRFHAKEESDAPIIWVSPEEYAKISHQIETYPKKKFRGLVFTANNFYLCDVRGAGNFRVLMEMPIEGNEDLIDYIHKNYGKNNSRIVESNADIDGRLQDARLSSRSRVSNNSSVEREQFSNSRLGGVDTSSEANGRRGDAKTVRTLEGQSEANNAAMTEAANSAAEELHTPVTVIGTEEELDALAELSDREKKAFKRNANGMYSIGSGKVYVYLPNCTDADEVKRIVLHEVVGHKGLRQLLGEQGFHDFCFKLYSSLPKSVRDVINRNALTKYSDIYEAMDEYLADEAEKDKAPTWWQKAAAMLRQFIRERLNIDIPLSINDAKYILWQSKNQLQQGNIISEAQHISMRRKLGINQKNDSKPTPPNGGGGGYRNHTRSLPSGNINTSPTTVSARDHYNRSLEQAKFYISEAFQDSMQGLKNLMDSIMQAAGKTYEDVKTWENPYLFENHMSSINEAEFQMFTQSFAKPLMETIKKLTNGDWKQAYDDLKLYMMAKHGLERNVVFAERDARKEIDYDKRKEELDDRLHKPNITQTEAQQILVEAQQLQDELNDAILAKREKDYSGISAMFADKVQGVLPQGQTPTLADYEAAARQYCRDYDSNHDLQDINDLWVQTKQCNMAIIGKQREGGLITAETELALNSMFQYYVPLRGFDETLSDEVYDYLNNDMRPSSSVIKKAKGRTSIANDPIATMANMAENSIVTANRNKMKRMLLYFAQNHPSDVMSVTNLYFANVGPNQWEVVAPQFDENDDIDTINRKREQFEQDMEQRVANDPTNYVKGTQPINMDYRTLNNQLGEHQVIVVDNGKQYVITINGNPRAAQAINGLTNPDNGGSVQRKFAAATRWLSMVNTTLAPEFVISNFGRDTYFANTMVWVKESPRYAMNYNRNWWISLWNIRGLTKRYEQGTLDMNKDIDRLFLEFVKNGGRTGFTAIYNVEKHKELIQEALRLHNGGISTYPGMAWDFIKHMVSFANEVIENTARFTAYMTSRQMGRPQIQAAHDAKEISVNFNKKGAGYKSLSRKNDGQPHIVQNAAAIMAGIARQSFVFFNAGVQGMQNFSSAARKHPYKFTAMSMLQLALGGIIVPLLNSIGGDDDDDDYFDLSDFERRQNICIRIGKGKFVKIPLPIELRAIYGLGDIVYGQLTGKNRVPKEALAHDVMSQFMQIVPFDPVTSPSGIMEFVPTVARPIVEIVANKDWTGKPIYKNGEWDKGKAEWERAYKFTNPLLVDASRALTELTGKNAYDADAWAGFNPAIAEHILKGYLGGAFSFANKTAGTASDISNGEDLDARRIPFVNRLYADVDDRQFQTKYVQGYFNLKDRVEKFNHQKKSLEDDLGTYANDPVEYAKVLSQYNKLIVSNDALIADLYKQAEKERKIYKNYEKKGFNVDEDLNILYKNTVKQQRKIDELE